MKNKSLSLVYGAALLAILPSCNRKEQTAGKGGNATLVCTLIHHTTSKNILNGKMYIAYNVSDIPSHYDDSATCTMIDGVPTASFSNLNEGKYYLSGTGYDTSISQSVKGGLSYEIKQETTLNVVVPVSETH